MISFIRKQLSRQRTSLQTEAVQHEKNPLNSTVPQQFKFKTTSCKNLDLYIRVANSSSLCLRTLTQAQCRQPWEAARCWTGFLALQPDPQFIIYIFSV
ncbi:hypothetical protein NC651_001087 [Populus alba x Populus x berolinensis]|nr:hypothetical protein NC651_001087 [Populus alba x Populus x berolinensis]